jgi:hypothetical protein
MKPNTSIEFAQGVPTHSEPMYFIVPDYLSVSDTALREILRQNSPKVATEGLDVKRITGARITTVEKRVTSTASMITRNRVITIKRGKAAVMELTFDGGKQGKVLDLRTSLPLIMRY